jgi:hypothetical protein
MREKEGERGRERVTLRVRACFMLANVREKCSPQGCAHPLKRAERERKREKEREREGEREKEKERVFILKRMTSVWYLLVIWYYYKNGTLILFYYLCDKYTAL